MFRTFTDVIPFIPMHHAWFDRFRSGLAKVINEDTGQAVSDPLTWLDRSGLAALLAGTLIVLITFFTSYSHVNVPGHGSFQVNQQIGVPLLIAALAALVGEVQLASISRCADQRDRFEARIRATEERNHSAEERNRANEERIRAAEDRECSALAKPESKLDSLLLNADSSSPIPPATDCN